MIALAAEARVSVAAEIVDALALYKHNTKLMQRLRAIVIERGDESLRARLAAVAR